MSDGNPQFLTDIGLNLKLVISGFWGGVCHALVFKQVDPVTALASVVVGTFTANYLGAALVHYVGWLGEPACGFIVGLSAMVICQGIVAAAKKWKFGQDKTDA